MNCLDMLVKIKVMVLMAALILVSSAPSSRSKMTVKPRIKTFFSRSFNEPLNNHYPDLQYDTSANRYGSPSSDKVDTLYSYKSPDFHDSFRYGSGNLHFGNSPSQLGSLTNRYGPQYNGLLSPYSGSLKTFDASLSSVGTTTSLEHDTTTSLASKFPLSSADLGLQSYNELSEGDGLQSKISHCGFGGPSDFMKGSRQEEGPAKELGSMFKSLDSLNGANEEIGSYWSGRKPHPKPNFNQKKLDDDPLYQEYASDFSNIDGHKGMGESKYMFRMQDGDKNMDYLNEDFGSNSGIEYDKNFRGGTHVNRFSPFKGLFLGSKEKEFNS